MSRTKGIALPGKSMEEATRNAQKDFLTKDQKTVDTATVKSGAEESPIVSEPSHKDRNATHTDEQRLLKAGRKSRLLFQNRHTRTGMPRTPMTCNALRLASTDTRASRSMV